MCRPPAPWRSSTIRKRVCCKCFLASRGSTASRVQQASRRTSVSRSFPPPSAPQGHFTLDLVPTQRSHPRFGDLRPNLAQTTPERRPCIAFGLNRHVHLGVFRQVHGLFELEDAVLVDGVDVDGHPISPILILSRS